MRSAYQYCDTCLLSSVCQYVLNVVWVNYLHKSIYIWFYRIFFLSIVILSKNYRKSTMRNESVNQPRDEKAYWIARVSQNALELEQAPPVFKVTKKWCLLRWRTVGMHSDMPARSSDLTGISCLLRLGKLDMHSSMPASGSNLTEISCLLRFRRVVRHCNMPAGRSDPTEILH